MPVSWQKSATFGRAGAGRQFHASFAEHSQHLQRAKFMNDVHCTHDIDLYIYILYVFITVYIHNVLYESTVQYVFLRTVITYDGISDESRV